jgi:hypothetical protein
VWCPSVSEVEKISEDTSESSGEDQSDGGEDEDGGSVIPHSPARGECIMNTAAALQKLTEFDTCDDDESHSEWLIIKVPKKMKHMSFLVDYCDGDAEDEFQWLKGPHLQRETTVEDLLDRKRSQSRSARRRQGHTQFRDDDLMDRRDHMERNRPM